MPIELTRGFCSRVNNAQPGDEDLFNSQPIVQIISVKPVEPPKTAPNGPERFRIILSDGDHYIQSMLATQLNHLIHEGVIGKHGIAKLDKFTANQVKDRRLCIILALTILENEAPKIGNPVALEGSGTPAAGAPAVGAPAAAAANTSAPPAPAPNRAPQQASSHTAAARRSTYPIESLSPYQNNWTIKARVTQKSEIKRWSNQRGEGHLFNVTFMDDTGEIRGTAFNAAADELYEKLQEGKVYYVSKARVNLAKKKFSNIQNDYELSLERTTEVDECRDTTDLPTVKYNFVEIAKLTELEKDTTCDVIGIVKEVGDVGSITSSKTSKTITKRELSLVDQSSFSVRLTLWGKMAEDWNHSDSPVVAFKGVKVGDFGGRSLSMYSSSSMHVNPDITQAHALRGWYDAVGANESYSSHSAGGMANATGGGTFNRAEFRSLNDVKESQLGTGDKADFFSTQATIVHMKTEPLAYPACPSAGCNKKVTQTGESWRCEKCDRNYDAPEYRYLMSFACADYSGQAWLSGFNEVGVQIFGMTATELQAIKERDESKFNVILHKANFATYNFSCRAKQDTYNDQVRIRYGVSRIAPVDYHAEAEYLRDLLKSPWAQ